MAASLMPTGAAACGGFFCNAQTQVPIVQAGERVVFAQSGERTTMHVEVRYSGAPTDFGWLVPVPIDVPGEGQPAPVLEEIVALSHTDIFTALDQATRPTFTVASTGGCSRPLSDSRGSGGCGFAADDAAIATSADATGGARGDFEDPVETLAAADIGPYSAELVHATSTDALFKWLGENGYLQDEKARPLIDHYVKLGYSFVGLRLKAGLAVADLRPVELTLAELAPCVPLRLTSVAATPNMPIQVWVLGEARAIPKNFLGAEVNLHALSWPSATNYQDIVTDAVDAAAGHAFVTEFAGLVADLALPSRNVTSLRGSVTSALSVAEIDQAMGVAGLGFDATYQALKSAGLDFAPFRARALSEIVEPLERQAALVASSKWVTRFFTTTDPDEMTRDPVFAFNPALPAVAKDHIATVESSCDQTVAITYPDGTRRTATPTCDIYGCRIDPLFGEVSLCEAAVLDETGAPVSIHEDDTLAADALLESALLGKPSIPAGKSFRAATPCVGHPAVLGTGPSGSSGSAASSASGDSGDGDGGGCSTLPAPSRGPLWVMLGLLGASLVLRRTLAPRRSPRAPSRSRRGTEAR